MRKRTLSYHESGRVPKMVLSKAYLKELIREGKAAEVGHMIDGSEIEYVIVNRFDIHRTDHYLA